MSDAEADQLRETYPEAYAAILARGVDQERGRVRAHLEMGKSCHAEAAALEAVLSGAEMTAAHTASYMQASLNHVDRYRRQHESDATARALVGLDDAGGDADLGDRVAAHLQAPSNPFVRP